MERTVVIDVVGLSKSLIGEHTPRIQAWLSGGAQYVPLKPVLPAVTTTAQTTYVTGKYPSEHGIVGNGWYYHDDAEIHFWKQSNHLVQSPKVWDHAKKQDPTFTCANSFWWYNMYSTADYSCTPRPCYPADGRKLPDCYAHPPGLRDTLQEKLGMFPLFKFWGPKTDRASSDWIAESAKHIEEEYNPTLHMVYLPHLDYCLMKTGTTPAEVPQDLREVDEITGDLIDFFEARGVRVILLSEYGMSPVTRAVHINQALRRAGLLSVRVEVGQELLDAGASKAFAVTDHQIAHIYVNEKSVLGEVRQIVSSLDGVAKVLDEAGKREHHIDHKRAGDLVAVSEPDAWFQYYYWLDDAKAPDFARCVDIHRKPGFDPVELFVDPEIPFPMAKAGMRLLQKGLGFRYLMDLIPLDSSLVRGSHGHLTDDPDGGPMFATKQTELLDGRDQLEPVEVFNLILRHLNLEPVKN